MPALYLIRHAKSAPSESVPEPLWPLSAEGEVQARELAERLKGLGIRHIYSSPFPRAVRTVEPLAAALGLEVRIEEGLRERKLCGAMIADWLGELELTWNDFDYRVPGGETSRECQERVMACLHSIATAHEGETLAVCSHGNALALALDCITNGRFGFAGWKAMRNPDVFLVDFAAGQWSFHPSHDG